MLYNRGELLTRDKSQSTFGHAIRPSDIVVTHIIYTNMFYPQSQFMILYGNNNNNNTSSIIVLI